MQCRESERLPRFATLCTQRGPPKGQQYHDFASLLFTLCALKTGKSVPWSGFDKRLSSPENDSLFKERRDLTENELKEYVNFGMRSAKVFLYLADA